MSQEIEADTASVEAQPAIAVEAEPLVQSAEVVAVATPVEAAVVSAVVQPAAIVEEEEDEMEFDMEWD